MNQEAKMRSDRWSVALMAAVYGGTAWLMSYGPWVYPPIPMFLTALIGGWRFRGRPQTAVRASLWAVFAWGWIAEWAYFSVRLNDPAGVWVRMGFWEGFGLGTAETTLYAALLGFFSAFVAWGSEKKEPAKAAWQAPVSQAGDVPGPQIPFQPAEPDLSAPQPPAPRRPDSR
ncbi:MAG: hypothetical protein HGA76_10310 [Candidatus Firestonebacteria bacterium]|nr:hypothetical protein [Candidatus Firestonebacteria bacterium]